MREERKIRFYRSPPEELVLLIVVFALFIVLVLTLLLIPLFSLTQQQGQTTSVRPETGTWLVKARQQQDAEKLFLIAGGSLDIPLGDNRNLHRLKSPCCNALFYRSTLPQSV